MPETLLRGAPLKMTVAKGVPETWQYRMFKRLSALRLRRAGFICGQTVFLDLHLR
jgi:hypothetical protein